MASWESMQYKAPSVEGLNIIVTGAAGGIGRVTSILLASGGAKIGLVDFADPSPVAKEINDAFGADKAVAVSCDVRSSESVEAAVAKIADTLGPIDGAANLAGVIGKGRKVGTTEGDLAGMEDDEWSRVMGVNIDGVKNCMRAELRHFNPKGGSIVNAASVAGQEPLPYNSAYGASKAAVISLTKSVAHETAARNIRINAICPGVVETPLMTSIADHDNLMKFAQRAALKRLALPEDIAKMIFWLLSDHSTFATAGVNLQHRWWMEIKEAMKRVRLEDYKLRYLTKNRFSYMGYRRTKVELEGEDLSGHLTELGED